MPNRTPKTPLRSSAEISGGADATKPPFSRTFLLVAPPRRVPATAANPAYGLDLARRWLLQSTTVRQAIEL